MMHWNPRQSLQFANEHFAGQSLGLPGAGSSSSLIRNFA
jgi:hypothetical protein